MWISSVHFYEDDISSRLERTQRIYRGMGWREQEGGIDKTPMNARIPDNIFLILSLYDSMLWQLASIVMLRMNTNVMNLIFLIRMLRFIVYLILLLGYEGGGGGGGGARFRVRDNFYR